MTVKRIHGQPPKVRDCDMVFLHVAHDGYVLQEGRVLTVDEGGGFDQQSRTHVFRAPGTIVRRVRVGNPHVLSVTEVAVPCDSLAAQ